MQTSAERHHSSAVQERQDGALKHLSVSVIVPVFNSAALLPVLFERLVSHLEAHELNYEIICVNDGSTDASWEVLSGICARSRRIKAINLVRNYGQHNAIFCGLKHAGGDYVVTIDDDLQNPPEEIAALLNKAAEGYDLVCGKFHKKRHSLNRRFGSWLINRVNEKIFYKPRDFALTNFRVMSRALVARVASYRAPFPYISGLAVMLAARKANVLVEHHERGEGRSTYSIGKLLALVSTILFAYSTHPLNLACTFGFAVAAFSFLIGAFYLVKALVAGNPVPGWTSLVCLLSFFNGALLIILSMIGEYVRRLLSFSSGIAPFYIASILNSEDPAADE